MVALVSDFIELRRSGYHLRQIKQAIHNSSSLDYGLDESFRSLRLAAAFDLNSDISGWNIPTQVCDTIRSIYGVDFSIGSGSSVGSCD